MESQAENQWDAVVEQLAGEQQDEEQQEED